MGCLVAGCVSAALLFAAPSAFVPDRTGTGGKDEGCITCHRDEVEDHLAKAYTHRPFVRQRCGSCHLAVPDAERVPATEGNGGQCGSGCVMGASLTCGEELMIAACYRCHGDLRTTLSHPVGVRLGGGASFPEDLPVLEDGTMTCVTCHEVHGNDRPWMFRRALSDEICVACHQGY